MKEDEVRHLAQLAQLAITDHEVTKFTSEIDAILAYVGVVSEVAGESTPPMVGAVHNVFRDDEVTNQAGEYSEALLAVAPERDGRFIKVKKILHNDG